MTTILAWPLKRVAVARLQQIADGTLPPPAGAGLLVSTADRPVQVAFSPPAEPDRICISGLPVRTTFRELTAEMSSVQGEVAPLEFRVQVFEPGEDIEGVDKALADMCSALVAAVLGADLVPQGRVWLVAVAEEAPSVTAGPEPSVSIAATVAFAAEVLAYG